MKTRILFVCLGNICRSPMAEAIMLKLVKDAGRSEEFEIDSAGIIGYHEGEESDPRMKYHAIFRGYKLTHLSRPVRTSDFDNFDLIIGMDDSNYDKLIQKAPTLDDEQKVKRMTDYCTKFVVDSVPDPYYGGEQGFENVIDILEDACAGLLDTIIKEKEEK